LMATSDPKQRSPWKHGRLTTPHVAVQVTGSLVLKLGVACLA